MKKSQNPKGFSLVELLITVVIITVLSVIAYVGINGTNSWFKNEKVKDDLIVLSNAVEHYKRDHHGSYPVPEPGGNMNVLCFNADASYAHDCDSAAFRQGMIDANLLTKRYLAEVPTDPRTGSRYVYGVSSDGKYFQVAGLVEEDNAYRAETVQNLGLGYFLPSLVRAYNSPNFVTDGSDLNLPYSPNAFIISATLENATGAIEVDGVSVPSPNGTVVYVDQEVEAVGGSVDLYFSDGSVATLDTGSRLKIMTASEVAQNDEDGIITKIYLKLFSGKVWNKVARLASESEFNIETTSAIAGVRGTEFGIDAGTGSVTVKSGEVGLRGRGPGEVGDFAQDDPIVDPELTDDEDTIFLATTDGSGNPQTYTPTGPGGPGTATVASPGEYDSYYDDQAIHNGLVPYIVAVDESTTPYTVYVSFNGYRTAEDSYLNSSMDNGFDIYTEEKILGYKRLIEEPNPDSVYDVGYDATRQAYSFTYTYTGEPIVLRAVKDGVYSDLSWPPQGFSDTASGEVWEYTDPETHPELALQAYIAGDRNAEANTLVEFEAVVMNAKDEQVDTEYFWTIKDHPEGFPPMVTGEDQRIAEMYATEEGDYTIALTVSNGGETSEESVIVVTIGEGAPAVCTTDIFFSGIVSPTGVDVTTLLSWYIYPPCATVDHYKLSIYDNVTTSYILENDNIGIVDQFVLIDKGIDIDGDYTITVKAYDSLPDLIDESSITFDTMTACIGTPVIDFSGSDFIYGATNVDIASNVSWEPAPTCQFADLHHYNLKVRDLTDGIDVFAEQSIGMNTEVTLGDYGVLDDGHEYKVTVMAKDDTNVTLHSSGIMEFTTAVGGPMYTHLYLEDLPSTTSLTESATVFTVKASPGDVPLSSVDVNCTTSDALIATISGTTLTQVSEGSVTIACSYVPDASIVTTSPYIVNITECTDGEIGYGATSCFVANGMGQEERICDVAGEWPGFTCVPTSCNTGYEIDGDSCVLDVAYCEGMGGYVNGDNCWLVAASSTESCYDVCNPAYECSADVDWDVTSICSSLLPGPYIFDLNTTSGNYGPALYNNSECRNDDDGIRSCTEQGFGPYKRICKCE